MLRKEAKNLQIEVGKVEVQKSELDTTLEQQLQLITEHTQRAQQLESTLQESQTEREELLSTIDALSN
jgi:hypothetical protein